MAGFVGARLLKHADSAEELRMILEFESEAEAAAWRASPAHARLGPKLKEFSPTASAAFSLLQQSSIGLKSGEYGGR